VLLERDGFDVVTPYLPGHHPHTTREFASRRRQEGTLLAAANQLAQSHLVRPTHISTPVHLIGHDWGAVLGFVLASRFSKYLTTYTSLAIPPLLDPLGGLGRHPAAVFRFDYIAAFQVPRLGERLLTSRPLLDKLARRWSPTLTLPLTLTAEVDARYADPTVRREVLAYYRALFSPRELTATWRLLAAPPAVPTLVLHGDADGCLPATTFPAALAAARRLTATPLTLATLPEVGHFPHLEAPDAVHLAWSTHVAAITRTAPSSPPS
jgi:pimeloyl-ACP methyl ester carboxylesterase